jgi:hypothetical protein
VDWLVDDNRILVADYETVNMATAEEAGLVSNYLKRERSREKRCPTGIEPQT